MSSIHCLLFDMDGLLVDSERVTFELWEKIFHDQGLTMSMELYISLIGQTEDRIHDLLAERFPGFDARTQLFPQWDEEYERLAPLGGVPLKKGVVELLDFCDSHGLKKSVVSSNRPYWVMTTLRPHGILDRFDHIIHGDLVKHGKPDPEPFLLSIERFGVSADSCLVLEDSNSGIIAGKRAGAKVICIPDLKYPSEEALNSCDAVFSSLLEVIPWLSTHIN